MTIMPIKNAVRIVEVLARDLQALASEDVVLGRFAAGPNAFGQSLQRDELLHRVDIETRLEAGKQYRRNHISFIFDVEALKVLKTSNLYHPD